MIKSSTTGRRQQQQQQQQLFHYATGTSLLLLSGTAAIPRPFHRPPQAPVKSIILFPNQSTTTTTTTPSPSQSTGPGQSAPRQVARTTTDKSINQPAPWQQQQSSVSFNSITVQLQALHKQLTLPPSRSSGHHLYSLSDLQSVRQSYQSLHAAIGPRHCCCRLPGTFRHSTAIKGAAPGTADKHPGQSTQSTNQAAAGCQQTSDILTGTVHSTAALHFPKAN